jgi:hypothetical protein
MSRSVVLRTCRAYLRPHGDCQPSKELPPDGPRPSVVVGSQISDHRASAGMCDWCDGRRAPRSLADWMRGRRVPTENLATRTAVPHRKDRPAGTRFRRRRHTINAVVASREGDSQSRCPADADISPLTGGQANGPRIATHHGYGRVSPAVPSAVISAVPSAVLPGICAGEPPSLRAGRLLLRRRLRHLYIRW